MPSRQLPPMLDNPDAIKRIAEILKYALRMRRTQSIAVEEVVVSYAGREWTVEVDDDDVEWWADTLTGQRRAASELTQHLNTKGGN